MIGEREAGEYFVKLWPMFCGDPVLVHLVKAVDATPVRGAVMWDDDGQWHVLADSGLGAREVFRVLFHELAHVVHGHTTKDSRGWKRFERAMLGDLEAIKGVMSVCVGSTIGKVARDKETNADGWANAQAAQWWPILEEYKGAELAAWVAWQHFRAKGRR